MFAIIGIVVVFGAIVAGYLMEHGKLLVLMQPAELVIIFRRGSGHRADRQPAHRGHQDDEGNRRRVRLEQIHESLLSGESEDAERGLHLRQKERMAKLETDVEEPAKSPVFSKYKNFLKDRHAVFFICDTLRMSISGGVGHFDLDQMMEQDMEVHHREVSAPVTALNTMADSFPASASWPPYSES